MSSTRHNTTTVTYQLQLKCSANSRRYDNIEGGHCFTLWSIHLGHLDHNILLDISVSINATREKQM